ncbi:MAG: tetratricopeptide repeat protein [Cyclobacteriaceae bacterium]|nr:tetratricopeptide repeat protein [Cyclobacteriaceae bacterium]MCH8517537.1 tetratricopeptide repeat protein [Cyclobacteriaceae bacterium]
MNRLSGILALVAAFLLLLGCGNERETLENEAFGQLDEGNYSEALIPLNQLVKKYPNEARYLNARGVAFFELEKYTEAVGSYNAAIRIDSTDYRPWFNRGNVKREFEDYVGAMDDYEMALRLKPNVGDIYLNRGVVLTELGMLTQAIDEFESALTLNGPNHLILSNKAKAELADSRFEDAIASISHVLEEDPELMSGYLILAYSYQGLGEMEEACANVDQAVMLGSQEAMKLKRDWCE